MGFPMCQRESARPRALRDPRMAVLCYVSSGPEIHIEVTLPDDCSKRP